MMKSVISSILCICLLMVPIVPGFAQIRVPMTREDDQFHNEVTEQQLAAMKKQAQLYAKFYELMERLNKQARDEEERRRIAEWQRQKEAELSRQNTTGSQDHDSISDPDRDLEKLILVIGGIVIAGKTLSNLGGDRTKSCPACDGTGYSSRKTCTTCGGSGIASRREVTCSCCAGKGERICDSEFGWPHSDFRDSHGYRLTCTKCKGTGRMYCRCCGGSGNKIETTDCPACSGRGWIGVTSCAKCGGKGTVAKDFWE
jgi:hypothetical protein